MDDDDASRRADDDDGGGLDDNWVSLAFEEMMVEAVVVKGNLNDAELGPGVERAVVVVVYRGCWTDTDDNGTAKPPLMLTMLNSELINNKYSSPFIDPFHFFFFSLAVLKFAYFTPHQKFTLC